MKAGQVRNEKRSRAATALVAMALLLLTVFSGLALADEDQGGSPVNPDSMAELAALTEGQQVDAGTSTDPVAAEELPHLELDRSEAENLFASVFPSILEEQAGVFNDLDVEAFRSDHVAVVTGDSLGAPAGLLTSLLPLRTEDAEGEKSLVDLGLEQQGNGLEPANPLVDVRIPGSLDEGISLPASDIGISIQGAPERQASVLSGEAAFYPNVAQDADLAIAPTPTGVETTMQLRSVQAPTEQTIHLSLPAGATLKSTDDGGAVVTVNDEPQLLVHPPSAIDANGDDVPVSMKTSGDTITITVDPKPTSALPILVDPVFDNYYWSTWKNSSGMYSDWQPFSTNEATFKPTWIGVWNEIMHTGLELHSYAGVSVPGERASWFYYVPRYFSDLEDVAVKAHPTSYIRYMTLSDVHFLVEEGAPVHQHPYFIAGIWSANKGEWVSAGPHTSSQGPFNGTIEAPNSKEVTDANQAGIMLATSETSSYPRQLYVGQAFLEVTDNDVPGFAFMESTGWVNATAVSQIPYKVSDSGLGIYSLALAQPKASGGTSTVTTSANCVGTASSPCPRFVESPSKPLIYEPGPMPQGENTISVVARDPVGNQSAPKLAKLKVDHTAPELSLSGNLTEQGSVGTKLPEYTLNYNSADGDSTTPAGMTPIGTAGSGAGQLQRPQGIALDAQGNIWVVDQQNNRVEKFGPAGNFISQFGTTGSANGQLSGPRGIAISPAGNIWVAEVGNKRVQEFNSSGGFIRAITGFSEPYGVATGPGEALWITDSGIGGGVYRYKENGTKLGGVQTVPGAAPGVAVDAFGNAWVTDQITDKVYEYNTSGNLLFSFGTSGTGEGQLNDPFGIAIAKSGNILVADSSARVQEFKPDGTFMRKFGTTAGSSQLSAPRGLAVGAGNIAYIADEGTHTIARWSHADLDPQSGAAKVEVKVDGTLKATNAPGCPSKNCVINGSWTMNADEYTVGTHKVEVIPTDAVGISAPAKTLTVETHGDQTAPTVALTGSITEQATLGTTLPAYKVKVAATDPGPAEERKSGVASIVIKVDGKTVDSTSPGCPSEGCSLNREWTLKSSSYPVGSHTIEATATDAAGKTKTASRTFEIKPDAIAPALTLSGAIAESPEGWIQEGTKSLTANATDAGGYGVKQIRFQIDGKAVGESTVQTCELGSCTQSKTSSINLTAFGGGAHEGVAIAEDLAGNVRKETWTINIDPLGQVTDSEAADTVEAAEATAPEAMEELPVEGIVQRLPGEDGSEPGLALESGEIRSEGVPVESTISLNPEEGFGLVVETAPEEGPAESQKLGVMPIGIDPGAGAPIIVDDGAAVIPNSRSAVDTILLPAYDGLMAFQDIRDASAPEIYSWEVTHIGADETLKLIDDHHAGLFWEDGTQTMTITAQQAHDATGASVPTTLTVNGHVVSLSVHHREYPYAYPVLMGAGWEGGFVTEPAVVIEPKSPEEEELEGLSLSVYVGPPEVPPASDTEAQDPDGAGSSTANYKGLIKRWATDGCAPSLPLVDGCGIWKNHFKGFYYYNFNKAWFPNNRQPQCEPFAAVNWDIDISECNWVGPNNQPYGAGYHITARTLWDVTFGLGVSAKTSSKAMVGRAFGSGNIYFHATSDICNPSRPDCG